MLAHEILHRLPSIYGKPLRMLAVVKHASCISERRLVCAHEYFGYGGTEC